MSSLPRCKGAVANCRVNEADVSRTCSGGYASERTEEWSGMSALSTVLNLLVANNTQSNPLNGSAVLSSKK